jgi:hypothetical protein
MQFNRMSVLLWLFKFNVPFEIRMIFMFVFLILCRLNKTTEII